jgi:glutamyl-tRNA reductase
LKRFKIIAFTHKSTDLNDLSRLFIEADYVQEKLTFLKNTLKIEEVFYLSTCNRIEFLLVTNQKLTADFLHRFYTLCNASWTTEDTLWASQNAQVFEGEDAIKHLFHVTSSLDSLVVGEREIIGQVRQAYEFCQKSNLTGDLLRIIMQSTVKTAKEIFTHTQITQHPVSVVSLAYRKLKAQNIKLNARFLIIGAGQTNTTMAKYLLKHGFTNFTVFNRSLANAQILATQLKSEANPLSDLENYDKGFDIILSCTGAAAPIITKELYLKLLRGDTSKKVIIDLAIPGDVDSSVIKENDVYHIDVANLKKIALENIAEREKELVVAEQIVSKNIEEFKVIYKTRCIELAMQEVPKRIKEIKHTAISSVFAKDIEQMDDSSKALMEKILSYMEKKYISGPMVLAKEIMTNTE